MTADSDWEKIKQAATARCEDLISYADALEHGGHEGARTFHDAQEIRAAICREDERRRWRRVGDEPPEENKWFQIKGMTGAMCYEAGTWWGHFGREARPDDLCRPLPEVE